MTNSKKYMQVNNGVARSVMPDINGSIIEGVCGSQMLSFSIKVKQYVFYMQVYNN